MKLIQVIISFLAGDLCLLLKTFAKSLHCFQKMPTVVGILTFISMVNTTSETNKARYFSFDGILVFMSS